jgi:uncharacterized OB-fold protein
VLASGKCGLYSYVIHHRPVPGFTPPYAIAVVEFDKGPRIRRLRHHHHVERAVVNSSALALGK